MSVDPIKFDNPIDIAGVPRDKLPVQFPARHEFDLVQIRQSALLLSSATLALVLFAYICARTVVDHVAVVSGFSRMLLLAVTVAVFFRWVARSQLAFFATAVVTAVGLFATATLVFIPADTGALNAICSLTMLTLLWAAAEVAIHFQSIDAEILRRDSTISEQRRQKNSDVLQFFAVVMGIAQCLALWTSMRLVFVPIAAGIGMLIAFNLVAEIAKYPGTSLCLTIKHYFGYPVSSSLAPGLIRSSAPQSFLRLLPLVLVIVGSALIPVADQGDAKFTAESALMAMYGVLVGLTALMLGASLSARPIHFDVDRTPFDVVVSKMRSKENINV